jgi:hypothetical protein
MEKSVRLFYFYERESLTPRFGVKSIAAFCQVPKPRRAAQKNFTTAPDARHRAGQGLSSRPEKPVASRMLLN